MEGEVCKHSKFGYCKYGKDCTGKHFDEECENLSECDNVKNCHKRHPKRCKRFDSGNCSFKKQCAYKHQKPSVDKDQVKINEKVEVLEKVVEALTQKVISLETKLEEAIQNKTVDSETNKKSRKLDIASKEQMESEKDKQSSTESKSSLDPNLKTKGTNTNRVGKSSVFIFGAEARKSVLEKHKSEEIEKSLNAFKCDLCDYRCEKSNTLKKHNKTKHIKQKCSKCSVEFKTSIDLLSHIAREHHDEEEGKLQSTPKSDSEQEKPDFVFSESMLDEFLV